jgi:hypothetical protein
MSDLRCFNPRSVRWAKDAGKQDRQDSGQKDPIESPGSADRDDRRAQPLHLVEVEEVGTDQRAETAADVSKRRRLTARQQQCDDCRRHRRHEHRECNPQARNGLGKQVAHHGHTRRWQPDHEPITDI